MDLATRIKELEQELSRTNDYKTLQGKITSLRSELNVLAPSLTPYEKEHFFNSIENVLKSTNTKLSKSKGKKQFFFKQKTSPAKAHEKVTQIEHVDRSKKNTTVGENYVLKREDSAFENLECCTVTSTGDPNDNDTGSGSFSFHNITKTVINLQRIYFRTGSIFMTDCSDSIILLRLQSEGDFQIRLRNLQNCKILIERLPLNSDCKQVVIIENCHDCIFNASTREYLIVQDFSNPFQSDNTKDNTAFEFKDFDTCGKDTTRLIQTYL